jgi:hypothetical protein
MHNPEDHTARLLQRFHIDDPESATSIPQDLLPLLLAPYRDASRVRHDFPLVLLPGGQVRPLGAWLPELAPPHCKALVDNLARLERTVRDGLAAEAPELATDVLPRACAELIDSLGLAPGSTEELRKGCATLCGSVPEGAALIDYAPDAALWMLRHAARAGHQSRQAARQSEVEGLVAELELRLRNQRRTGQGRAAGLKGSGLIDTSRLAGVLGRVRAGTATWDPARVERVAALVARLRSWLEAPAAPVMTVVGTSVMPDLGGDCACVVASDPIAAAVEAFEGCADAWARVVAAIRGAQLELDSAYVPALHDGALASLDWRGMSRAELTGVGTIVAIETGEQAAGSRLHTLCAALLSGRPLQILVTVQPSTLAVGQVRLGSMAVALQRAWVQQTSTARPLHMVEGFNAALASSATALHVMAEHGEGPMTPWFTESSAIDARAHPLFRFDPGRGDTWQARFDFQGNPSPEQAWPTSEELPFSFADHAMCIGAFRNHFWLVPEGAGDDQLVEVAPWLALTPEQRCHQIPFVWGARSDGQRLRVAITRTLAFATQECALYWRSLQELSGVRNAYAEDAAARARAEGKAAAAREREAMEQAHREAIAEVRRTESEETLRRLAHVLMDSSLLDARPAAERQQDAGPPVQARPDAAPAPAQPDATRQEEEDASFDDPYIDSELCTSCNECTDLNPVMFTYDANKQAVIADPDAGSFAELVRAAELCSAKIIHPGRPRNPSEAGLPALMARVAELGV